MDKSEGRYWRQNGDGKSAVGMWDQLEINLCVWGGKKVEMGKNLWEPDIIPDKILYRVNL